MEERKPTGYPSLDRPQDRFYRKTPLRKIQTEQTVYELVFRTNANNLCAPALEYMGVIWTFQKLKDEVDKAADAFAKTGLSIGDVALIGVSNSPEAVVTLLALNKLGVVSKWFDIRASEQDIEASAEDDRGE